MRFSFLYCVPVVAAALTVFACSDTVVQRVVTNPEGSEAGVDDGGVVDDDGSVTKTDAPAGSKVDVSHASLPGYTESSRPDYVVAVPKTYSASKKYPLILVIHGDGGDGTSMRNYHTLDDVTGDDAIVVYPSGNGQTWDQGTAYDSNPDQKYLVALIAAMKAKYSVGKTFGVGWSAGGFIVNIMACRKAGIWDGLVSHAGGQPYTEPTDPSGYQICAGNPKYPAFITNGDKDTAVDPTSGNYDAQFWAHYNGCNEDPAARTDVAPSPCKTHASCPTGLPVTYCLIPGNGHGIWSQAVTAEWDFLKKLL